MVLKSGVIAAAIMGEMRSRGGVGPLNR
jgi:hypothetical protein